MARVSKKSKTSKKKVTRKKATTKKVARKKATVKKAAVKKAPVNKAAVAKTVSNISTARIETLLLEQNKLLRGVINAVANMQNVPGPKAIVTAVAETKDANGNGAKLTDFDTAQPKKPEVIVTKDQVVDALQKVSADEGMPRVKELLESFDVQRISDIPADKYPAFLEACSPKGTDEEVATTSEPASTSFL